MRKSNLKNMIKGWFIGQFEPTLFHSKDVEVAIKKYKKGDTEVRHHHRVATEITVIVSGKVWMNEQIYKEDDIIVIEPFESTDFIALSNSITAVVKMPGTLNDKFYGEFDS
jgi:hypothetical protein